MEHIISQLGPNQVTVAIEPSKYIQTTSPPSFNEQNEFSSIPDPIKMFEKIKYANKFAPPPPPPPPPRVSLEPYTLFMHVLMETDPKAELLSPTQKLALIKQFQTDLQKNLDNEKGLFKLFGFSKKRSVTLEALKAALGPTDKELTDDAILYLAKLLNKRIVIYNDDTERTEHNPVEQELLLFKKSKEQVYAFVDKFTTSESLDLFLFKELVKQAELTRDTIKAAKIAELRVYAKFTGIKPTIKKEIQDTLCGKFDLL